MTMCRVGTEPPYQTRPRGGAADLRGGQITLKASNKRMKWACYSPKTVEQVSEDKSATAIWCRLPCRERYASILPHLVVGGNVEGLPSRIECLAIPDDAEVVYVVGLGEAKLTDKCVLQVDTDIPDWHKGMCLLFESMEGVTFSINAFTRQAYISGKIDPLLQMKLLAKAEATGARLCWLYYGCEVDLYGRLVHNEPEPEPEPKDEAMNSSAPTSKPKNSFCCLM
ncbi:hypothetical protein F3Y22_tig00110893pilonHSYRG01301 [Hibiscus syriacus]|uniref:Uncharacterized protein n=1 Tax=Hibiscus syriacus TaxID=106335 RepID=A0A6A2ZJK4_HIBSY|nr:hypothetical protein F3Y22_tig00110893pilonHSYRG01301 [Hibiscus syriacus]